MGLAQLDLTVTTADFLKMREALAMTGGGKSVSLPSML